MVAAVVNPYLRDSPIFLAPAADMIAPGLAPAQIVVATTLSALGIERLLKAVLFDINPLYVLMKPEFAHSIALTYPSVVLPAARGSKAIASDPDGDVLAFSTSLARAKCVCAIVERHAGKLHYLVSARDLAAHCPLDTFDHQRAQTFLLRDFYPICRDFAERFSRPVEDLLGMARPALAKLAIAQQATVADAIELLIGEANDRWKGAISAPGHATTALAKTEQILKDEGPYTSMRAKCPACANAAVLYGELEYDLVDHEPLILGVSAVRLRCCYCDLDISDADYIEHLDLTMAFMRPPVDEL